ncbi:Prohibitin [Microtus ochrogaster]|uniref:Prohibitin n=1 Tax=Microtus ochrogaster TaxID=79684 RepID=A0A8J6GFE8_MICOH|nr:Prohibitin [Microtus ochrogaster]
MSSSIAGGVLNTALYNVDAGHKAGCHGMVSVDLTERAATFGLILDDVSLTQLTFGKEFTEAVEAKQVAQQGAERARFVLEKSEQQKKRQPSSLLIANSWPRQAMA